MQKNSPKLVGFFEALGVAAYVGIFAIIVQFVQALVVIKRFIDNQILAIFIFLLTFIISALICASIVLAYPIRLFFSDRRKEAFQTIFWCAIWLVLFLVVFALLGIRK